MTTIPQYILEDSQLLNAFIRDIKSGIYFELAVIYPDAYSSVSLLIEVVRNHLRYDAELLTRDYSQKYADQIRDFATTHPELLI